MSEISQRYARLSRAFADKVAAVPEDRWSSPSPCEEWTARDVVRHVVDTHGMFLGFVGRELGDIPSVDDDPRAAFDAARTVIQRDLDDPDRASAPYESYFGPSTFEAGVDRFLNFDLIVHNWDLSRAAGLDETIDPQDVALVSAAVTGFGDALRSSGAFGNAVDVPDDADEQTKMLALLGRRV